MLRKFPPFPSLLSALLFSIKGLWILLNAFSATIELILWIFFSPFSYCDVFR